MGNTQAHIESARASGDWNRLAQGVPYAQFLGFTLEVQDGQLVGCMKFSGHLIGNPVLPALHGGTLGSLLELGAQFELMFRAQTVVVPKTITLTIDYLRSGRPLDTRVGATIVRHGRRVATVQAFAWQEAPNKPIATATLQMLVMGNSG